MTMERNLNERKKGIRDVCKRDGRGFGAIVILPLCHSASLSLYYKSFAICDSHSWLSHYLTKSLLVLIVSLPTFIFSVCPSMFLNVSQSQDSPFSTINFKLTGIMNCNIFQVGMS